MKILILHTGGTIAMHNTEHGVAPDTTNPLSHLALPVAPDTELVTEEMFNLPSPHITLKEMLALSLRIRTAAQTGFTGVVITHGTDTLEETAYFLQETIGNLIPVALTGAMRSSNELGSDGLYNLLSAIRVASSTAALGRGVVVVMNDEIHAAQFVTKTHTTNVATFRSPTFGPVGVLTKHSVRFFQSPAQQTCIPITSVAGRVPIIKAYAGMTDSFFKLFEPQKLDGLVIEALGAGNLPPKAIPGLHRFIEAQVPVVLVSRCFNGIAEPVYSYEGGGVELAEMGIIFTQGINAQKARLKLIIGLNSPFAKDTQALTSFLKE